MFDMGFIPFWISIPGGTTTRKPHPSYSYEIQ